MTSTTDTRQYAGAHPDRDGRAISYIKGVSTTPEHRDIFSLLSAQALANASATAIEASHFFDLTYAGLFRRVQQIMMMLRRDVGVDRRDVVAIALPDGPELAVTLLAVSSAAVCAPLNPNYTVQEFKDRFNSLGAKFLIVPREGDSAAVTAGAELGLTPISFPVRLPTDKVQKKLRPVFQRPCLRPNHVPPEDEAFDAQRFESTPRIRPNPEDVAMVLQTSGTTSRPKTVPLTHANICTSVYMIRDSLDLDDSDRCLSMLPQFHIGGLVDLLLVPLASGGTTICSDGFAARDFFHVLRQFRPTWYQAVPTMLHDLVAHIGDRKPYPSTLKFIRSVSAPLPKALLDELEATFQVPVIEMYGMTEAGPMICSNLRPPKARRIGSVGKAFVDELAVVNSEGDAVPRGQKGEVVIRGDNVVRSYMDNPEANEQSFRHGWFRTGDLGYLDPDGYLYLEGRTKEVINRGGEKISPVEVEKALADQPAVAQAAVFPVPHETLGENVAAAVVLHPGAAATEQELREHAASRLADFKIPHRIRIVEEIPTGATGKIQRMKLAELIDMDSDIGYVPPRNDIEKKLIDVWKNVLQTERVGIQDNFFELGGHSLLGIELVDQIESTFNCRVPDEVLYNLSTVENMAAGLRSVVEGPELHGAASEHRPNELAGATLALFKRVASACSVPSVAPGSLMLVMNPNGLRTPLFWCFNAPESEMPGIGKSLGADYPLYGMYAGSAICDYTHTNVKAAANTYAREILELRPDGPYLIGGNCRGGAVAFEIALILQRMGKDGIRLCLMEYFHPDVFGYKGDLTLLYGKRTPEQLHKRFNWGEPGWVDRFAAPPIVLMLEGRAGWHWGGERLAGTTKVLANFIDNTLAKEPS